MRKLNLGCGAKYKGGWTNLDWNPEVKLDVQHDLRKLPYPFKKDTFDLILVEHVIEHIPEINPLIEELWRISKNKGKIIIQVPHWSHYNAWVNIEHQRGFTAKTFDGYNNDGYYSRKAKLRVKETKYDFTTEDKKFRKIVNRVVNPVLNALPKGFVETFLCKIVPIYEVTFVLEAIKGK